MIAMIASRVPALRPGGAFLVAVLCLPAPGALAAGGRQWTESGYQRLGSGDTEGARADFWKALKAYGGAGRAPSAVASSPPKAPRAQAPAARGEDQAQEVAPAPSPKEIAAAKARARAAEARAVAAQAKIKAAAAEARASKAEAEAAAAEARAAQAEAAADAADQKAQQAAREAAQRAEAAEAEAQAKAEALAKKEAAAAEARANAARLDADAAGAEARAVQAQAAAAEAKAKADAADAKAQAAAEAARQKARDLAAKAEAAEAKARKAEVKAKEQASAQAQAKAKAAQTAEAQAKAAAAVAAREEQAAAAEAAALKAKAAAGNARDQAAAQAAAQRAREAQARAQETRAKARKAKKAVAIAAAAVAGAARGVQIAMAPRPAAPKPAPAVANAPRRQRPALGAGRAGGAGGPVVARAPAAGRRGGELAAGAGGDGGVGAPAAAARGGRGGGPDAAVPRAGTKPVPGVNATAPMKRGGGSGGVGGAGGAPAAGRQGAGAGGGPASTRAPVAGTAAEGGAPIVPGNSGQPPKAVGAAGGTASNENPFKDVTLEDPLLLGPQPGPAGLSRCGRTKGHGSDPGATYKIRWYNCRHRANEFVCSAEMIDAGTGGALVCDPSWSLNKQKMLLRLKGHTAGWLVLDVGVHCVCNYGQEYCWFSEGSRPNLRSGPGAQAVKWACRARRADGSFVEGHRNPQALEPGKKVDQPGPGQCAWITAGGKPDRSVKGTNYTPEMLPACESCCDKETDFWTYAGGKDMQAQDGYSFYLHQGNRIRFSSVDTENGQAVSATAYAEDGRRFNQNCKVTCARSFQNRCPELAREADRREREACEPDEHNLIGTEKFRCFEATRRNFGTRLNCPSNSRETTPEYQALANRRIKQLLFQEQRVLDNAKAVAAQIEAKRKELSSQRYEDAKKINDAISAHAVKPTPLEEPARSRYRQRTEMLKNKTNELAPYDKNDRTYRAAQEGCNSINALNGTTPEMVAVEIKCKWPVDGITPTRRVEVPAEEQEAQEEEQITQREYCSQWKTLDDQTGSSYLNANFKNWWSDDAARTRKSAHMEDVNAKKSVLRAKCAKNKVIVNGTFHCDPDNRCP